VFTQQEAINAINEGKPYLALKLAIIALIEKPDLVWPSKIKTKAQRVIYARRKLYSKIKEVETSFPEALVLVGLLQRHVSRYGPIGKKAVNTCRELIQSTVICLVEVFEYQDAILVCNFAAHLVPQLREHMSKLRLGIVLQKNAIQETIAQIQIEIDEGKNVLPLICFTLKIWVKELEFAHPYHQILAEAIFGQLTPDQKAQVLFSVDSREAFFSAGSHSRPGT
jgi:hypothetical protein